MISIEERAGMDLNQPVEVAHGIWWVGMIDPSTPFQCHPYLIDDGFEAVLFEPGPVSHFPAVLRKVRQVVPIQKIRYIVVSHQDPDVCGSLPLWEKTLELPVQIVTHSRTTVLIPHYGISFPAWRIDQKNWLLELTGGRKLKFIFAPGCHSPGTFMTYDEDSRSLFSGDIFGAIAYKWSFYADEFYIQAMRGFHDDYMASAHHLGYATAKLSSLPIDRILPQHGSVINKDIPRYLQTMASYKCGINLLCAEHAGNNMKGNHRNDAPSEEKQESNNTCAPQASYSQLITMVIEREKGVVGKEDALSIARGVGGIKINSEGNCVGIHGKDGRDILNHLLNAYEKQFGFWSVFNCRLMIHNMAMKLKLELPDVMKRKVTDNK